MEELFDTYNINGDFLEVKPKSFCHSKNPGVYHKPVWIWIINSKNKILIQKRAKTKKNQPGLWDASVAGHVHAGEDMKTACKRETLEEIGISIEEDNFKFIAQIYFVKINAKIEDMKLEDKEVEIVKYVDLAELKEIMNSKEFVPYPEEYKRYIASYLANIDKK